MTPSASSASAPRHPPLALPQGDVTFALLKNGDLVASAPSRDKLIGRNRVTHSHLAQETGFPLLAPGHGEHPRLYVLAPTAGRDTIAVVDPTRLRVTERWRLPRSVAYRAVVVGPRSDKLYVFGNRANGKATMGLGEDAVVTVVLPHSGEVLWSQTVRRAGGRDWYVYAGGVSPDEKRLLLSYHGADTTGIDVVELAGGSHTRCEPAGPRRPSQACLVTHGDFVLYHGRVIATIGEPPKIREVTLDGRVIRSYDSRLRGNHLMEFAADLPHDKIYPIGSCDYSGGLSVIDLTTGSTHVLVPASWNKTGDGSKTDVCGSRARYLPGAHAIALAAVDSLRYADARTGAVQHSVHLPAEVADLVVMTPTGPR